VPLANDGHSTKLVINDGIEIRKRRAKASNVGRTLHWPMEEAKFSQIVD